MEHINMIIGSIAAMCVVGLAWIGGYELGQANGKSAERGVTDRRIQGLLAKENQRKTKTRRARK